MISRERVQAVIDRIRPLIQGDGCDIELVDVVDNKARIRMSGNCIGCPSAQMTLFMGIKMALQYNVRIVDIRKGDQFAPEFLEISPNGKIPAIVDPDGPGSKPVSVFESARS